MPRPADERLVISGVGVTSAIGGDKDAFADALRAGRHAFGYLARAGRTAGEGAPRYVGAEIGESSLASVLDARTARTASWSARVAASTLAQAWDEARLSELPAARVGLVVGGSNVQQRDLAAVSEAGRDRVRFVRPSYASSFLDTDLVALCAERFGIRGACWSVGAASASGQMALIHAAMNVATGQTDACVALGALMDLSVWELQALRSAGAMGTDAFADAPAQAARPFDRRHDGFIFGENCAALVVETAGSARRRGVEPYAEILGWGIAGDASRGTAPSLDGEVDAINRALHNAAIAPADVDYYNAHGTGSPVGDATELSALHAAGLAGVAINATKSITGHGLTAAGAVEIAATLLQMKGGWLHPTRNLDEPIDPAFDWITGAAATRPVGIALSLSLGFGGINTAVCLRNVHAT